MQLSTLGSTELCEISIAIIRHECCGWHRWLIGVSMAVIDRLYTPVRSTVATGSRVDSSQTLERATLVTQALSAMTSDTIQVRQQHVRRRTLDFASDSRVVRSIGTTTSNQHASVHELLVWIMSIRRW